ncbi:glycosyltransferase [bacterium]|nr:glycosyltransferase [bacterium]
MIKQLDDYREIVGDNVIASIHRRAAKLYGKHVVHINSTYQGGGVAEMLQTLVPLMNDVGVDAGWRILHGNPDFFGITKKFHNAIQGEEIRMTDIKKELYTGANENFATYTHLDHDFVIVHDPQPLPLIQFYQKRQPWIWRCHIDLSNPSKELWDYFKHFLLKYDTMIVSNKHYLRSKLPINQRIIPPAIDPLSAKNKDLDDGIIPKTLDHFNIPIDKPILTQISRFDKWKDPLGVLDVFKKVKKEVDCRLILCGSMAADDPEGIDIYEEVKEQAGKLLNNGDVILLTVENNLLVNVLQRVSDVIIQKSIREGFGLTVTEALWKGRPVVASNVGGIPLQISNGKNGFLFNPDDNDGYAKKIIELMTNPDMAKSVGHTAKESVRSNFLITRLLGDYLELLSSFWKCPIPFNNDA